MVIEIKEKGSKEFYKEVVNVTSQYKHLIKKPEAKLNDKFRSYKESTCFIAKNEGGYS